MGEFMVYGFLRKQVVDKLLVSPLADVFFILQFKQPLKIMEKTTVPASVQRSGSCGVVADGRK
ncbi:MAG: hypothetical protein MUC59_13925, partial [Saprospiraceae bacterium]|nr:hypothetical protein [Saprospiraceae bacterium]